jgi:hypothetical protein
LILASSLAVAVAITAPGAAAAPPAVEEYVLTLPGAKNSGVGSEVQPAGSAGAAASLVDQRAQRVEPVGVTGERQPSPSALAGIGAAAASPGGVVLALALAAAVALALRRTRDQR